jgi:peptidoglycan/LPS O-acetylase OafA/YrhL
MIKRLEQVAALVVAAGLAIVSYWLFFSWAQRGGSERRGAEPVAPAQRRPGADHPSAADALRVPPGP